METFVEKIKRLENIDRSVKKEIGGLDDVGQDAKKSTKPDVWGEVIGSLMPKESD